MNCDVCGENLKGEDGFATYGVKIELLGANPARPKVEKVFGKNSFKICHVCWLKSLGVKPIKAGKLPKSS